MQEFTFRYADDRTYCVVGYQGDEADVVVPETYGGQRITVIWDGLFSGHKEIRSVKLPDTVTSIGEFVFDGCENLRHIDLPSQLEHLWGLTFVRSGIEEIVLPDKVRSIPPFAFKDCKNLKKVVGGKGLESVSAWAFGGCDQLTEFLHGDNVEISPLAYERKN